MRKIYDCFPFFCELDILDLRLNILDPYVDFFVIRESNMGFGGAPKKYFFEENKHLFEKFLDKIIYVKVENNPDDFNNLPFITDVKTADDMCMNKIYTFVKESDNWPKEQKHWGREYFQRESIHRGLINCDDDDIIIFSDIDEIPNPNIIADINNFYEDDKLYLLKQKMYYYYLNMLKETGWNGPIIASYKYVKNTPLNDFRIANKLQSTVIEDGGWHFSYMGGVDRVKYKIENGGHQELNTDFIKNNVAMNIENARDIFNRGTSMTLVELDDTYPKYLLENLDKYDDLIYTK